MEKTYWKYRETNVADRIIEVTKEANSFLWKQIQGPHITWLDGRYNYLPSSTMQVFLYNGPVKPGYYYKFTDKLLGNSVKQIKEKIWPIGWKFVAGGWDHDSTFHNGTYVRCHPNGDLFFVDIEKEEEKKVERKIIVNGVLSEKAPNPVRKTEWVVGFISHNQTVDQALKGGNCLYFETHTQAWDHLVSEGKYRKTDQIFLLYFPADHYER